MSIGNLIGIVFALIIIAIGVVMIYDARFLTQKWFSFGDQNEGTKTMKIVGFILAMIGCAIIYWIRR